MSNHKGNSIIELLVFMPIFLVFTFVSIDTGFALKERAAIIDSISNSLNTSLELEKNNNLFLIDDNYEQIIDKEEANKFLINLAQSIYRNIDITSHNSQTKSQITLALIMVNFDEISGVIQEYEIIDLLEQQYYSQQIEVDDHFSLEDYIQQKLNEHTNIKGQLSILGKYKKVAYLIASEVRIMPDGPSSNITNNFFNLSRNIYQRNLTPLKSGRLKL